jgi:hypothetical protein
MPSIQIRYFCNCTGRRGSKLPESEQLGFADSHHVFTAKKITCHVACQTKYQTPSLVKSIVMYD